MHHLGVPGQPEWDEFRQTPAEGPQWELNFEAPSKNTNEWTLFLRQRDVKVPWRVQLNGRALTNLFLSEDDVLNAFPIQAGALHEGANKLMVVSSNERDDILLGEARLDPRPVSLALGEGTIKVRVTEDERELPCRITVVDQNGSLAPMLVRGTNIAARPGVAYLGNGAAEFQLPAGDYTFYAGRGFEYSVQTQRVTVARGSTQSLNMVLRREVDTKGYVASDTHVHTFTYSRHGDATDTERAITLAGEGIELPIATDHNIVIDPTVPAKATGMDRYFTPVFGDEVTTSHAHFNIFPLPPGSRAPNHRINDWPQLMQELRGAGCKVVILNHPRNIHNSFQPFASTNFNAETGENLRGFEFTFDAVEVVNSSAMQSDWMISFRDWMALLNHGYRVTAVGSSDGHDVSRYIIGQGRSYVAADDLDPSEIDIDRACDSILKGRVLVSMGLLADMKADNRFGVGDLATNLPSQVEVMVTVQHPSWSAADSLQLFANGKVVGEKHFPPQYTRNREEFRFTIDKPAGDAHLIAIVSGPPVSAPFWKIPKPYQPTSTAWNPRVIAATNPIWLDADSDGKFTPFRLQRK